MNSKIFTPRFLFVAFMILAAAAMRLIPHWPNFTPVAAIALFGGAYMTRKAFAFIIPFAAMLLSDLIIGFHGYMIAVYFSFAIAVTIGVLIRNNIKFVTVIGASLTSSVLFFLITNFAVWLGSPFYPQSVAGLMECYAAGLPFFNDSSLGISFFSNEILGGLFYNGLFFGAFALARYRFPALVKA